MNKWIVLSTVIAFTVCGCEPEKTEQVRDQGGATMTLKVTSTAFEEGGMIPAKYTADGQDISPPLAWSQVPEGTRSVAIINDDPDAPMGTWVHWLVWNIPPDVTSLDENVPPDKVLANGACQGTTDFRRVGYGGPAPPSGVHRYFFKVYALDTVLNLPPATVKSQLEAAMKDHILAQGQLVGKYTRNR